MNNLKQMETDIEEVKMNIIYLYDLTSRGHEVQAHELQKKIREALEQQQAENKRLGFVIDSKDFEIKENNLIIRDLIRCIDQNASKSMMQRTINKAMRISKTKGSIVL